MSDKKLEDILSFHNLVIGKEEIEKKHLAQHFSIDYDEYKRRIKGKEVEMEFLLIAKSLKVLKHLEAFDESLSHITGEFTSDFLVEFADGYKCMIEIKSTDKEKFEISGGNLQNRIDFATRHNVPLRFAILHNGYWTLYTSEYLQSKNGKIEMNDEDLNNSWFDEELGTLSYGFINSIMSESVYENETVDGLGIFHEDYGEMKSYKLFQNKKLILTVDKSNVDTNMLYFVMLIELQNYLSGGKKRAFKKVSEYTVTEKLEGPFFIPEYQSIKSCVLNLPPKIGTNSSDNIMSTMISKGSVIPYVDYLRLTMKFLHDNGMKFIIKRGMKIYSFDVLDELWSKSSPGS